VVGLLSIGIWVAAILALVLHGRRLRKGYSLVALGLSLVAIVLAKVNSSHVSAIKLDRRDEIAAVVKAQKEQAAAAGEVDSVASAVKFAEGDPEEAALAYRKQGKQVRTAGKHVDKPVGDLEETTTPTTERFMAESDLRLANRLDRVNLLIVRLIWWVAWVVGIADYLSRFNSTAHVRWPLPISGRWLDGLFHKTRAALMGGRATARLSPERYVQEIVMKGENFVYFGDHDPSSGPLLHRLRVWKWAIWSLPKLLYGAPAAPRGSEFALDAAWFGRYGVVMSGKAESAALLADMVAILLERYEAGASARVTLHLIWDLPELPPMETVAPLIRVLRETNLKLVVWPQAPVPAEFAALFEEQISVPDQNPVHQAG
jgi:hypothetical protein